MIICVYVQYAVPLDFGDSSVYDASESYNKGDGMNMGKIVSLTAVIGLVFFIIVPCASAQHLLSDVWFKMKIVAKGHTITAQSSPIEAYNNTSTVYVRFWPTLTAYLHNWQMWSQNSEGEWGSVTGTQYIYGATDGIIWNWETEWGDYPPVGIAATIAGVMKIKRDGSVTKNAKFSSTGCHLIGGQTEKGFFYGGCKVTGKTVAEDKLPFQY